MAQPKELYEFLVEAELDQYYTSFTSALKVTTVPQIKYVEDEDLTDIGMTKPEMRRLRKFYKKENESGALSKIKKMLIKGQEDLSATCTQSNKSPQSVKPVGGQSGKHLISEDDVVIARELGHGEFGVVNHAVWKHDGSKVQVAVRTISKSVLSRDIGEFVREMSSVCLMSHQHLSQVYGLVLAESTIMMVMELAPQRSLWDCLRDPVLKNTFSVNILCDLSSQICDAMQYLEAQDFVHRDLCARNVLVFSRDTVKVSDYGLTRCLGIAEDYYQVNVNATLKLAAAWCAPECISSWSFTSASDVWAFGVTLWEMFSYGFQPWAGFTNNDIITNITSEKSSQHLEQPDRCPRDHYDLMLECWQADPSHRPRFEHLSKSINSIKPTRMMVHKETTVVRGDCLMCKNGDLLTVLDKRPCNPPEPGLWKFVLESTGRVGYFNPECAANYIDIKPASQPQRNKALRKESSKRSTVKPPRLHAGMISGPQHDLRHTGHVGCDGSMFGDVAFIGKNFDHLPVKVRTPPRSSENIPHSVSELITGGEGAESRRSSVNQSKLSINSDVMPRSQLVSSTSNGSLSDGVITPLTTGHSSSPASHCSLSDVISSLSVSRYSVTSSMTGDVMNGRYDTTTVQSQDPDAASRVHSVLSGETLTDVSSVLTNFESIPKSSSEEKNLSAHVDKHTEEDDFSELTFSDFKIPDLMNEIGLVFFYKSSLDTSFDLGQSLMDEVLRAFDNDSSTSVMKSELGCTSDQNASENKTIERVDKKKSSVDSVVNTNQYQEIVCKPDLMTRSSDAGYSLDNTLIDENNRLDGSLESMSHSRDSSKERVSSVQNDSALNLPTTRPVIRSSSAAKAVGVFPGLGNIQRASLTRAQTSACQLQTPQTRTLNSSTSPTPSSASSAEFFSSSGVRFSSSSSGGSLPGRNKPIGISPPASGDDTNPLRKLRDSNAFSKTKARIKSSVSSVTSALSGGASSKQKMPNSAGAQLNINLPFFDRLREQEQEQEELEAKQGQSKLSLTSEEQPGDDLDKDYLDILVPSTSNAENSLFISEVSEDRLRIVESSDLLSERWRRNESHDSSENSSVTHQSDEGVYTDDSQGSLTVEIKDQPVTTDSLHDPQPSPADLAPTVSETSSSKTNGSALTSSNIISDSLISKPKMKTETKLSFKLVDTSTVSKPVNNGLKSPEDTTDSENAVPKPAKLKSTRLEMFEKRMEEVCAVKGLDSKRLSEMNTRLASAGPSNKVNESSQQRYIVDVTKRNGDNVNYEDLMENALNDVLTRRSSKAEIKAPTSGTSVTKKTSSVRDDSAAGSRLSAVVKQTNEQQMIDRLMSLDPAIDADRCRQILEMCDWNVSRAVDYLIANPCGQDSPEFVHV